jgi:hypothetical protein
LSALPTRATLSTRATVVEARATSGLARPIGHRLSQIASLTGGIVEVGLQAIRVCGH